MKTAFVVPYLGSSCPTRQTKTNDREHDAINTKSVHFLEDSRHRSSRYVVSNRTALPSETRSCKPDPSLDLETRAGAHASEELPRVTAI